MVTSDIYKKEYDVIIVGGGATGAGTARDCALRGLSVLLVERNDYSTGATGRNHGLMHSGARYAVTDSESASECISENMILRRIARHCVEETDGLFITLPEDDLQYQQTFVEACKHAGIRADIIDPQEARSIEPAVNPELIGAVRVPDASIDPFRLTVANLLDARMHGAETLNYHEVEGLIINQNRVEGVKLLNKRNGEHVEVHSRVVVNAAGIWGQRIAQQAGVNISMFPARGALLIFGHRVNNMVINRCRKPANADILVNIAFTRKSQGPRSQVEFRVTSVDAATQKQIGGHVGTSSVSSAPVVSLLQESVVGFMDNFTQRIMRHFEDVATNGREGTIIFKTASDCPKNFESMVTLNGEQGELADAIEYWLAEHAKSDNFTQQGKTRNRLAFEQVRFPLFGKAAFGRQKAINAEGFIKPISTCLGQFGLSVSTTPVGIGKVYVVLGRQ